MTESLLLPRAPADYDQRWVDRTFALVGDYMQRLVEGVATPTATEILTELLTVDGAGSGLDADLLDGSSSAAFAAASHTHPVADVVLAVPWQMPQVVATTSDQTLIGTAYTDVTGLGFSILASATYYAKWGILADADATTTGIDIAFNGPASPTFITEIISQFDSVGNTMVIRASTAAYDVNLAAASSGGVNTRLFWLEVLIRNGVNAGTLIPRIKREAVGTGPNVRTGSFGMLWRLA